MLSLASLPSGTESAQLYTSFSIIIFHHTIFPPSTSPKTINTANPTASLESTRTPRHSQPP
jgi:hypothetical protein